MIGERIICHKINSGYKQDYGYYDCKIIQVVTLCGVPRIKVLEHYSNTELLAWYRNNEWVIDLD